MRQKATTQTESLALQGVFLNFQQCGADECEAVADATFDDSAQCSLALSSGLCCMIFCRPSLAPYKLTRCLRRSPEWDTSIYKEKPELNFFNWPKRSVHAIEFAAAAFGLGTRWWAPIYRPEH